MTRYAKRSKVGSERSRQEIEKILTRYGATGFGYGWDRTNAVIMFEMAERRCKFVLPLPDRKSEEFRYTPSMRYTRSEQGQQTAYEQAVREKWRALALVIKAKLEAVESGITLFETEFMPHIIMPDGKTVAEHVAPKITEAYSTGRMPPMLTHGG